MDEAHCIETWGTGQSPFRETFGQLRVLRAQVPSAKVIALTATATTATQEVIKRSLLMGTKFPLVTARCSPDRPGVFLSVHDRLGNTSVRASYFNIVDPILKDLQEDPSHFPKTIMYLPLGWCGQVHQRALYLLPDELHHSVAQFHSPQTPSMKEYIPPAMEQGSVKLVFATEALGMGADIADIRRIIHVSPPKTLTTYMQEIGRAGRDGQGGEALMYINKSDLAHVGPDVKDFCTANHCRRAVLLKHFQSQVENEQDLHICCDVCRNVCVCPSCSVTEGQTAEASKILNKKSQKTAEVMLEAYFKAENSIVDTTVPELVTGLSSSLAKELSKSPMFSKSSLKEKYASINECYLDNIHTILEQIHNL